MIKYKVLGVVAAVFVALWFVVRRKSAPAPVGNVELGIPSVKGSGSDQFGGTDYGVTSTPELSDVERMNAEAEAAIAGYQVPENPWGIR